MRHQLASTMEGLYPSMSFRFGTQHRVSLASSQVYRATSMLDGEVVVGWCEHPPFELGECFIEESSSSTSFWLRVDVKTIHQLFRKVHDLTRSLWTNDARIT
jgi:hypothetical protein